jgi:putative ATP-dependent endonuclease of the OLD family
LEWCLSKSLSIGKEFQNSVKKVHPNKYKTGDFDENLADHLKKKGLKKTEVAYDIALKLDEDLALKTAKINIDENDNYIKYLLDAIKYACQD